MSDEIKGFCAKRFRPLEDAFRKNFEDGLEIGASLGVTWRGKMVVDLWAGFANPKRTRRWRKHTLVPVNSVTKIMILMCVYMLIDRGKLRLDEPVCKYWPEFAQGGKDKVTVRDFITHQGGVPGFVPAATFEELVSWKLATAHIAAQPHRFGGQKVLCYHPVTYGYVLGELVRRVDGRMPAQFFRDMIKEPAGLDFHMGLTSWFDLLRIAEPTPLVTPTREENALAAEILGDSSVYNDKIRTWKFLSAQMPSVLGFGNGRSVARAGAILANRGRLGWKRYMSKEMVDEVGREQVYGEDLYIGPIRWGLGVGLDSKEFQAPSPTTFHWGGLGGAWIMMDPATRVSLGYAPNRFASFAESPDDKRVWRFIEAMRELLPTLSQ